MNGNMKTLILPSFLLLIAFQYNICFASEMTSGYDDFPHSHEQTTAPVELIETVTEQTPTNQERDRRLTNHINSFDGNLLEAVDSFTLTDQSLEDNVHGITNLINRVQTPAGARTVLNAMPDTIDRLLDQRILDTPDLDQAQLDKEFTQMMDASSRLVNLLATPEQGQELVTNIMSSLGQYYQAMDPANQQSKKLMNAAIDLSNVAVRKAGTVNLSWKTITIKEGQVNLAPSRAEIRAAAENAARLEEILEGVLKSTLGEDLEDGIVSTLALELPNALKDAAETGATLSKETLEIMKSNKIDQVQIDLGAVGFTLNQQFVTKHPDTELGFNAQRRQPLLVNGENPILGNAEPIDAPVIDLSASQDGQPGDAFKRPVQLSFDISELSLTPSDFEKLSAYRLNEKSGHWEPVGGVYDPVTNTIRVHRLHLSKYTILKAEHNYSNIEDSWAKNEITSLKGKGIIEEDNLFAAKENVTREEFATWIAKAYGLDTSNLESDLKDLDPDSPYYGAIAVAYEQGIISGRPDGTFDPKGHVSKEEMAVMIANAMDTYDTTVNTSTFELAKYEDDLPTWAVNSVETLVENGIVEEEFFGSAEPVTKEQAAAILYEAYR